MDMLEESEFGELCSLFQNCMMVSVKLHGYLFSMFFGISVYSGHVKVVRIR